MQNYIPLPHDEIRLDGKTIIIDRVFPTQIICHRTGFQGIIEVTREKFDQLAKKSFTLGAALFRNNEQIYPSTTIATEPEPTMSAHQ